MTSHCLHDLLDDSAQFIRTRQGGTKKKYNKKEKRHPATKTFQAIRMHINQELDQLRCLLNFCLERTKKGGRISIISFHSLEDRIVKRFFRDNSRVDPRFAKLPNIDDNCKLKIILKKIRASNEEIRNNSVEIVKQTIYSLLLRNIR